MDYSNFSISFSVTLLAVLLGLVVGIVTLVLVRRKKRLLALIVGISSALLLGAWVLASGLIETAGTNAMLKVADQLAVPKRFEPGKDEKFRGERVVRATAFLPCMAVTAPLPVPAPPVVRPRTPRTDPGGPRGSHSRQRLAGQAGD